MKKIVVARTHRGFEHWCNVQEINPRDPSLIWIGEESYHEVKLRGIGPCRLIWVSGYPHAQVLAWLHVLKARGVLTDEDNLL